MRYKIPSQCIERWVSSNFDYKKKKNGWIVIRNPFYHNDNQYFNINTENGACHDWRDDSWAGPINPRTGKRPRNIVRFVQLYKGTSFRGALNEIVGSTADIHSIEFEKEDENEEVESALVEIPSGYNKLDSDSNILKKPIWDYLIGRGYEPDDILSEDVHYGGSNALWLYREFGQLVYLQSRNIYNKNFWFPPVNKYDNEGKLVSKLEITREHVLYGFDDVPRLEYVILTESIFCRAMFGKHALSVGGASLNGEQIKRIDMIGPKEGVILAYDNDKAAIESILDAAPRIINKGYKVYYSIPPRDRFGDGHIKDWNEMYTHLKLTKPDIVETMNKRLTRFDELSKMKLKKNLFELKNETKSNATRIGR